jgi:CO dehydrogenase nickel-insertion accessory protein CooC1
MKGKSLREVRKIKKLEDDFEIKQFPSNINKMNYHLSPSCLFSDAWSSIPPI